MARWHHGQVSPGESLARHDATCRRCGRARAIDLAGAERLADRLVAQIERARAQPRTDAPVWTPARVWDDEVTRAPVFDPRHDPRALFEPGGGKMFGVLIAQDEAGEAHELRAFSGTLRGVWHVEDWAPPLFDVDRWHALEARHDPEIKAAMRAGDRAQRAARSAALMRRYHDLYCVPNRVGVTTSLEALFGTTPVPSGAGDCCGPKLLAWANRRGLTPHALVEVYVGASNRGGTRHHGRRYAPCESKCGPLIGFFLCDCDASDR